MVVPAAAAAQPAPSAPPPAAAPAPAPVTPLPPPDLPDPGHASDPDVVGDHDGGLILRTRDDAFRIGVGGWLLGRYEIYDNADNREQHFLLPSARLIVAGHAFSTIDYVVSTELGNGTPELRDAYIDQPLPKHGMIRFGQFKPFFSHQQLMPRAQLTFTERAQTFDFAGISRDIGVALHHEPRVRDGGLEVAVGMFNGEGISPPTPTGSARPLVTARVGWRGARLDPDRDDDLDHGKPRAAVGIGYAGDLAHAQSEDMVHTFTVDLVVKVHGLAFATAVFAKSLPGASGRETKYAWHAQLGYALVPHLVEVAGRFSQVEALVGKDHIHEIVGALDIYRRAHALKWQIEGGVTQITGEDDLAWVARVQTQVMF